MVMKKAKWIVVLIAFFALQKGQAQTFDFECFGGYLTGTDCQICTGQTTARLFNGLIVRRGGVVQKLIDCPYFIRQQGSNLVITELIPNPESITINLLSSGFSTITGFRDSVACMCARQDSSWIGGGGGTYYQTFEKDGTALTQQPTANFTTSPDIDWTLTNDGANSETDVQADIKVNAVDYAEIQQVSANRLLGNPTGSTANVAEIPIATGLFFSGGNLNVADRDSLNEAWTIDADDSDLEVISSQIVKFEGAGINTTDYVPASNTLIITGTEVDGSTINELQTIANTSDATSHTVTLSNSGGSVQIIEGTGVGLSTGGTGLNGTVTVTNTAPDQTVSITGGGVNVVTGTYPNFTVTGTEVDGSTTNEAWTIDGDGGATEVISSQTVLFSGAGINSTSYDAGTNTLTVTGTEADGSVSNEGVLGVSAGGANTSTIVSNTSGSTPVTVSGSTTILVTESGSTITVQGDTSLLATVNDLNGIRNRDDSTFVKISGSYVGKRISDNVYRAGTTGFRTDDTTGVLNVKTRTAKTGANIISDTSGNGTTYISLAPPAWDNVPGLREFSFMSHRYVGVNSPYNPTPNFVYRFGYNQNTDGSRKTSFAPAGGIDWEFLYHNASLPKVTEFHLYNVDSIDFRLKFVTSSFNWNGARGGSRLAFQSDVLSYNDQVSSQIWQHKPLENLWDFQDTVTMRFGEARGFGLYVLNGSSSSYMNLLSFNNTDEMEMGRQNVSGVRITPPTAIGGSFTPVSKLDIEGNVSIGTSYSGTTSAPANGAIIQGDVGIGNSSPSQRLHISGNARVTGAIYDSNNDPGSSGQVLSSTITGTDWTTPSAAGVTGSGANDRVAVWTSATNLEGDADFQWDGSKVKISGIPAGQQDILTSTNTNAGSNDQTTLRFYNDLAGNGAYIGLASSGRTSPYGNALFYWNALNGPIAFATNNAERMRITNNGLIIGSTANAINKLDVEGAAVIGATYSGTNAASSNGLLVEGNVGIGNTSAQRKLHVTGEARITDLDTDPATRVVGADADGDLDTVGIGAEAELHLTNGTLGTNFHTTISPTSITANQTDYNPSGLATAWVVRLSADDGFRIIRSLVAPSYNKRITFHNAGSNSILFANQCAFSGVTASYRFDFGRDIILFPGKSIEIMYDVTSSRWRLLSKAGIYDDVEHLYFNERLNAPVSGSSGDYYFWDFVSENGIGGVAPVAGRLSGISVNTGSSATGIGYVASKDVFFENTNASGTANWAYCKALIKTPAYLSNGTEDYTIRIGFADATGGGGANDGFYFDYNHANVSGNWGCNTTNAGNTQRNNSGIAVTASTNYLLEVFFRPDLTAEYYINGTRVATNDTFVPAGTSDDLLVMAEIQKNASTAQRTLTVYTLQTSIAFVK